MSFKNEVVRKARQTGRQITESVVPLLAEGTAQGAELAADGVRHTADAARRWADDVNGVTTRRRLFAGLGFLALLSAFVVYLTSSSGRKAVKRLPEPVRGLIEKAS